MALGSSGLATWQWNNNFKSVLLLALLPVILVGVVWVGSLAVGLTMQAENGQETPIRPGVYRYSPASPSIARQMAPTWSQQANVSDPMEFAAHTTTILLPWVLGAAGIWMLIGFLFHQFLIDRASGARPLQRRDAPELYNLLENLCISCGQKMPVLHLIDTPQMNAFASGLSDSSYTVTVTRGLVESLDAKEMEAVLAHELSHIRHRDVRLLVICVVFSGLLALAGRVAWESMRTSSWSSGSRRDGRGTVVLMLMMALVIGLGYMMANLVRFALSRRREFMADAGAVALTKNPDALASALIRISSRAELPGVPAGVMDMCIENPASQFFGLFSTHPSIPDRIAALRMLGASIVPPSNRITPEQAPPTAQKRGPWSRRGPWG
ncbi:MAG: M48 family metallopeptidase [Alphaproteobacteria bacterium]|nr:MAG: M48 family metallopeptidase [Alphaproteobacteria bacterium]